MMRLRFNRLSAGWSTMVLLRWSIWVLMALCFAPIAWGDGVTPESANRIVLGQIRHHIAVFGSWNGAEFPAIADHETISRDGEISAYHFRIDPSGFVIVAANDALSPVQFYSTRSSFDISRAGDARTIESWIVSRLNAKAGAVSDIRRRKAASGDDAAAAGSSGRIGSAWTYFNRLSSDQAGHIQARSLSGGAAAGSEIIRGANVGPLLATIWGQGDPYNTQTPDDSCAGGHTLTGCVATAWAQVLRYWQWPPRSSGGEGTKTYTWGGQDLSVDFSNGEAFDWSNMPGDLNAGGTTQNQIDAVSKLIYYLAVSAEMDFGCADSASSVWADEVLDDYFRYKPLDASNRRNLLDYTASQWFAMIKNELDADPPRPIIFTIRGTTGSSTTFWHEVVIDGYQEGVVDKVHINFGWEGTSDAYYDITDDSDFDTTGISWDVGNNQIMVIGIEPDNSGSSSSSSASSSGGGGGGCFLNCLIFGQKTF